MKDDEKSIKIRNDSLFEELSEISRNIAQSEISRNWANENLHKAMKERAINNMSLPYKSIGHTVFIKDTQAVAKPKQIKLYGTGFEIIRNEEDTELPFANEYGDTFKIEHEVYDETNAKVTALILKTKEDSVNWS